jgi:hypothetical protein
LKNVCRKASIRFGRSSETRVVFVWGDSVAWGNEFFGARLFSFSFGFFSFGGQLSGGEGLGGGGRGFVSGDHAFTSLAVSRATLESIFSVAIFYELERTFMMLWQKVCQHIVLDGSLIFNHPESDM